jgi:hypothetical protein
LGGGTFDAPTCTIERVFQQGGDQGLALDHHDPDAPYRQAEGVSAQAGGGVHHRLPFIDAADGAHQEVAAPRPWPCQRTGRHAHPGPVTDAQREPLAADLEHDPRSVVVGPG